MARAKKKATGIPGRSVMSVLQNAPWMGWARNVAVIVGIVLAIAQLLSLRAEIDRLETDQAAARPSIGVTYVLMDESCRRERCGNTIQTGNSTAVDVSSLPFRAGTASERCAQIDDPEDVRFNDPQSNGPWIARLLLAVLTNEGARTASGLTLEVEAMPLTDWTDLSAPSAITDLADGGGRSTIELPPLAPRVSVGVPIACVAEDGSAYRAIGEAVAPLSVTFTDEIDDNASYTADVRAPNPVFLESGGDGFGLGG